MFDETVAVLSAVGALATAAAVFVAVWQLRTAKEHARTNFEDDLSREYRTIVGELPAEAFYVKGDPSTADESTRRPSTVTRTSATNSFFSHASDA